MDVEALAEGTLRSYLRILFNRKWSVMVVVVLTMAGAYLYTHRQATVYQSSAQLLLEPTPTQEVIQGASLTYSTPSVPDEVQRLEGNGVAAIVDKKLGYVPGITGSELGQTDVMLVTATAPTAELAAKIANTYAQAYLEYVQQSAVTNLMASNQIIEQQLTTVSQQLNSLQSQLATATKDGNTAQVSSIQAQVNSLESEQNVLTQEVTQISQATQLKSVAAELIATATPPPSPIQPDPKRNLLFGLVAGFILGIGFVVAREYFDDTIRSEEELNLSLARSERTARVLVLGAIPFGEEVIPGTGSNGVASITDPASPQAEAYRELRTSLQFLQVHEPVEVVLITSPSGGEGKSTTLANLSVMLARTGKSIVMASCDLRRPRLYDYFGLSNKVGFTSVIVGEASLSEALQPVPGVEGLTLLSAGPLPPNPAELLASPGAEELVAQLQERFDVVLIDSPPVLRVTDAAVLSTLADTTLLVVRAGLTTRRDMVKGLETFEQIGSPVAGIVCNALPSELTYKDRYYYSPYEPIDFSLAGNGNGTKKNGAQKNGAKGNGHTPDQEERQNDRAAIEEIAAVNELPAEPPAVATKVRPRATTPETRRRTKIVESSTPLMESRRPGAPAPGAPAPRRPVPPPQRGRVARFVLGPPKRKPPRARP